MSGIYFKDSLALMGLGLLTVLLVPIRTAAWEGTGCLKGIIFIRDHFHKMSADSEEAPRFKNTLN